MDNTAIHAAAVHSAAQREARAEYKARANAKAQQFGTAIFHVGNRKQLEEAREGMQGYSKNTVQKIYLTTNNRTTKRSLKKEAFKWADEDGYLVIFEKIA